MMPLRRHQLAWLTPAGWEAVVAADREPEVRAALAHWAARGLPLVVTRQPPQGGASHGLVALGLAAPLRWASRKIAVQVAPTHLARTGDFPSVDAVTPLLPPAARGRWRTVCTALKALGLRAHVHGSHGWQQLSGEACVHARSDLDLHVAVGDRGAADAAAALLARAPDVGLRLDGELVFPDGAAVAWREWQHWRQGLASQVMVKRLHGVALEDGAGA